MMLPNVELMFVRILRSSISMVSVVLVQIGRKVRVMVNLVDQILALQAKDCLFLVHVKGVSEVL